MDGWTDCECHLVETWGNEPYLFSFAQVLSDYGQRGTQMALYWHSASLFKTTVFEADAFSG